MLLADIGNKRSETISIVFTFLMTQLAHITHEGERHDYIGVA